MNWSATFLGSLSLQQNLDFCLRILIALLCGGAIGFERSRHFKEAGIRTHVIVCVGAALIMVVSKYGFVDLALDGGASFPGTRGADASRI
ncbi:MAG: MgtC/SapB family protein, partial [Oscillospiraceae bacterium]|nr:MgtC/SapB family protein [Oscillospiraceae bacterium]